MAGRLVLEVSGLELLWRSGVVAVVGVAVVEVAVV